MPSVSILPPQQINMPPGRNAPNIGGLPRISRSQRAMSLSSITSEPPMPPSSIVPPIQTSQMRRPSQTIPAHLQKYVKMYKMKIPRAAILNKMSIDGQNPEDFDRYDLSGARASARAALDLPPVVPQQPPQAPPTNRMPVFLHGDFPTSYSRLGGGMMDHPILDGIMRYRRESDSGRSRSPSPKVRFFSDRFTPFASQRPPQPIVPQRPVQAPPSEIPAHLKKYAQMHRLGVPKAGILNKMRHNGHNPDDFERYILPTFVRPAPFSRCPVRPDLLAQIEGVQNLSAITPPDSPGFSRVQPRSFFDDMRSDSEEDTPPLDTAWHDWNGNGQQSPLGNIQLQLPLQSDDDMRSFQSILPQLQTSSSMITHPAPPNPNPRPANLLDAIRQGFDVAEARRSQTPPVRPAERSVHGVRPPAGNRGRLLADIRNGGVSSLSNASERSQAPPRPPSNRGRTGIRPILPPPLPRRRTSRGARGNMLAQIRGDPARSPPQNVRPPGEARRGMLEALRMRQAERRNAAAAPPEPRTLLGDIRAGVQLRRVRPAPVPQPRNRNRRNHPVLQDNVSLQDQLMMRMRQYRSQISGRSRSPSPTSPPRPPQPRRNLRSAARARPRLSERHAARRRQASEPKKVEVSVDDILSRIHELDLDNLHRILDTTMANIKKRSEEARQQNDDTCIMCLENKKNVAFPCGHICCCVTCSGKLTQRKCPICRKSYRSNQLLKLYL